ncbi:MAG: phosphoribosylanthranilate isomerase [Planctomycetes bacterium]|nr:phosphoribosylanthranilate isomerase [Planctomycetota bacterium]MBI3832928.1 phosphoribosylanthranilate isomerase [Planctomycetota bacterium]
MTTWVKVCGLTSADDAGFAVELGVDALGFVLHPKSRRYCVPNRARTIIRALPSQVVTIGVWFDEPADCILESARFVGCDLIQTYDPNTALVLQAAEAEVLPAIPILYDPDQREAWRCFLKTWSKWVLLDRTRSRCRVPPTGVAASVDSAGDVPHQRMILAGGLTPENVRSELELFRPWGIDVASGVESEPGTKCRRKLTDFIKEVRQWDAMISLGASADNSSPKR